MPLIYPSLSAVADRPYRVVLLSRCQTVGDAANYTSNLQL